jgi:hypothetical protein
VSGSTQAERQIPIVNRTEDEATSKQPKPIATQPRREAAKDLTVLPTEHVARAEQPQQEVGAKEGFPASNSPTIAQPSIAPARGPWLFPDSSSRYLSATDLSSLSSLIYGEPETKYLPGKATNSRVRGESPLPKRWAIITAV